MSNLIQPKFKTGTHQHRLAALTVCALITVGCSSSGGSGSGASDGQTDSNSGTTDSGTTDAGTTDAGTTDSGNTAGQMDENSTDDGSTTGESFPTLQGELVINERRVNDVRTLRLNARFVEWDTRIFTGNQFFQGNDRCVEIGNGTSISPPDISAGEVLVLSNPNGTLAELNESSGYSVLLESITAEQTIDLSFDIPGGQYPALPTISVQNLDELSGVQPELGSEVSAGTVFQWAPSSHPDTLVILEVFAVVSGQGTAVTCWLVDDGEFSVQNEYQSLLGTATTTSWSMSRSRYVEQLQNGAYLGISRSVSTDTQ